MIALRTIVVATLLIAASPSHSEEIPPAERRSGYSFMSSDTQSMQNDDTANPGMLWVLDGEALWNSKSGATGNACADCHKDAQGSMKGVAARYPAFDKALGRPFNLEQRINLCRVVQQQADTAGLREPRTAGADRIRRAAVARHGDRDRRRSATGPLHRQGPRSLHAAAGPA